MIYDTALTKTLLYIENIYMTLTIFRYISLKVIWYLPASTKMHLVYVNCINIINEMLCSPVELKGF